MKGWFKMQDQIFDLMLEFLEDKKLNIEFKEKLTKEQQEYLEINYDF